MKERDGLLMALLLTECMAQSGKDLGAIIDEMLADIGRLEFARRGLSITDEQMARFRAETVPAYTADEIAGKRVLDVDRRDGVKLLLEGDAWVMMRPSGTEPLRAHLRRGGHHRRGKRTSGCRRNGGHEPVGRLGTTRTKGRQSHCALAARPDF